MGKKPNFVELMVLYNPDRIEKMIRESLDVPEETGSNDKYVYTKLFTLCYPNQLEKMIMEEYDIVGNPIEEMGHRIAEESINKAKKGYIN